MKRSLCLLLAAAAILCCGADWLQFRGVNGSGRAPDGAPPIDWSNRGKVAWTAETVGRGVSSPIVVNGRVIITANDGPKQERLLVLAYDAKNGDLLWRRQFWATGRTATHPTSAVAANSPASDGKFIYAFYSSNDLICLDLDGNLQWFRGLAHDYPKAGNDVGMAASPLVVGDTVVVQIENQGDSFAAGIDKSTGETKWRVDRPARANWSSPIAMPNKKGDKFTLLLQSGDGVTALDPETGGQLWKFEQSCDTVASASTGPGLVYVPSKGLTVLSVEDDSNAPEVVWDNIKMRPSRASAVIGEQRVFTLGSKGVVACCDLKTGDLKWQKRLLKGDFWATPVLANNHLYAVNQDGEAFVVDVSGETGKVVFSKKLGEAVLASPVASGNALFIRGESKLWKIGS